MILFSRYVSCSSKAGRLIPRVLERRREREGREAEEEGRRDEDNPEEPVEDQDDEAEATGDRNQDIQLPSPRNNAQTPSGNPSNEENYQEAQEESLNERDIEGD